MDYPTSPSSSTRQRQDYLPVRASSSGSSSNHHGLVNKPSRPEKSTRRIATDRRNKIQSGTSMNGKGKESDEEILRREVEQEWSTARRERGVEDSRNTFNERGSTSSSPKSMRRVHGSSSKVSIPLSQSGNSISRGKRRKMTIGEDEKVIIKPRPTSISSIASSDGGDSIYEDARDYFEEITEEHRAEYELGGTRPLFSLLPSPFPNSSSSRRPSHASSRSQRQNSVLPNKNNNNNNINNNHNNRRGSASTSSSSSRSSPAAIISDLPSLSENPSRRSWTPKPLVLTPSRILIPLRPISAQGFNGNSSTGSNGPLSPLIIDTASPISRPGSAMSYIVNSPTSDGGGSFGTRRRKSLGYFVAESNAAVSGVGIASVLNASAGRNYNSNSNGRRKRDSNSSSTGYYGTDMKRSGSDHSQEGGERESPDSSYDVWEEGEGRNSMGGSGELGVNAKISDILEVVEEISGLWQEEDEEEEDDEEEEEIPPLTPVIHLSLPSPIQNKTLSAPTTSSSSYSHSLATLDETALHFSDPPSSIALEPPTPPPPFPLPVLPPRTSSQQDDRFFSPYTDFLKTRGSGTRSVQSNEVYDAYWDANSPATQARLIRADSSNYGSEDGSVNSRVRKGLVGEAFLNTASAIARRNTLNKGFPPSPPSSHSDNSSIGSNGSSQYGNALEEQLRMESELLDGLTPKVVRIMTSTGHLNRLVDKPLPALNLLPNPSTPKDSTTTTTDLDYPTPSPPVISRNQVSVNEFGAAVIVSSPKLKEKQSKDLSNYWPPLDDGKTKVMSLSPRLEALNLEDPSMKNATTSTVDKEQRSLRHQSSLASSTGSRRWSSNPLSSMMPNKTKRDSKLSKSANSRMVLCIPMGGKAVGGQNGQSERSGLDVFGISEDEEEEYVSVRNNGSIKTQSSTGSIIRLGPGGKKINTHAGASKRLFSFSKKSITSLRSGSPSPSLGTSPARSPAKSSHSSNNNEWNGRTTVIASSPPVIPTLIALSPVDSKHQTWNSLSLPSHSMPSKRFSTGSSYSERRPVPSYHLPPVVSTSSRLDSSLDDSDSSPPSPPRLKMSYLNRGGSPPIPSPSSSLAVATALGHGPPSPRIPPPQFHLPTTSTMDQAPILPHIRKDSDPLFNSDLTLSSPSTSSTSNSSRVTTPTTPATTIYDPSQPILLQHTFPALRGSDHSPHGRSVVSPVHKVKVLETNPRVTFGSRMQR